jgi:hypothetical protein
LQGCSAAVAKVTAARSESMLSLLDEIADAEAEAEAEGGGGGGGGGGGAWLVEQWLGSWQALSGEGEGGALGVTLDGAGRAVGDALVEQVHTQGGSTYPLIILPFYYYYTVPFCYSTSIPFCYSTSIPFCCSTIIPSYYCPCSNGWRAAGGGLGPTPAEQQRRLAQLPADTEAQRKARGAVVGGMRATVEALRLLAGFHALFAGYLPTL